MENILQTVKQFLEFSDEKLEELKKKNQMIKLQKDEKGKEYRCLNDFCSYC